MEKNGRREFKADAERNVEVNSKVRLCGIAAEWISEGVGESLG